MAPDPIGALKPEIVLTTLQLFRALDLRQRDVSVYSLSPSLFDDLVLEEIYSAVMAIPIHNPKMNDERREIHEWNSPEIDKSIQAFLLKKEAKNLPLGKHFHRNKLEAFFILEGEVERLVVADGEDMANRREFTSHKDNSPLGRGTVILIPPNAAHTFYFKPGSRMICFSSAAFDPNNMDMAPVELI